jgi:multimeric flavodoxin WrbA
MSQNFALSKKEGAHYHLGRLTGSWAGTAKTWFDPSKLEDESPVSGTLRSVMDGLYVLHEYSGSFQGKPLTGMAIIGYNLGLSRYECAWIDSFHTSSAILFSEGKRGDDEVSVLGSYAYVTPETEQQWGWRTVIEMITDDEMVITAYNISPEGEETKATETVYKRVEL